MIETNWNLFDEDNYPTDETLEKIKTFHWRQGVDKWFQFIFTAWFYPEFIKAEKFIDMSTGGWSGNESIIAAMQANTMCWTVSWVQSRRGGHYTFEIPEQLTAAKIGSESNEARSKKSEVDQTT